MLRLNRIVSAVFFTVALGISAPAFAESGLQLPIQSQSTLQECPHIGYGAFVVNTETSDTSDIEALAQAAEVSRDRVTLCKLAIPDRGFLVGAQVQLTTIFNQEHLPTFQLVQKLKSQGYQAYLSYTTDEPIQG